MCCSSHAELAGDVSTDGESEDEFDDGVELELDCPSCGEKECGWMFKWSSGAELPPFECIEDREKICGVCGMDEICDLDGFCVPGGCTGECDEEIHIPGGLFCMQEWDQYPPTIEVCRGTDWNSEVWVDEFYIDKYEVTNKKYRTCYEAGICPAAKNSIVVFNNYNYHLEVPNYFLSTEYDNYPVMVKSYRNMETFCQWEGKRLPLKEEWLMAALGACASTESCDPRVDSIKYPWGNEAPEDCSVVNSSYCVGFYQTVGAYPLGASPYDLMDTYGNAGEWLHWTLDEDENETYPFIQSGVGTDFPTLTDRIGYYYHPDSEIPPMDEIGGRCARDP